jgi:hypothetical protein
MVRALLANGEILDEHRKWAIREAAGSGHLEIISILQAA